MFNPLVKAALFSERKMMIKLSDKRTNRYLSCGLFLFLLFAIFACSEAEYSMSTAETGSAIFSVKWVDAPRLDATDDSLSVSAIDCGLAGVSDISCNIYDASNNLVFSAGPWECSDHSATMDNIPVGYNYRFVIFGQDFQGMYVYRGETPNKNIEIGVTTDVGLIEPRSFKPELLLPDASDGMAIVVSDSLQLQWIRSDDRQVEGYHVEISQTSNFISTIKEVVVTSTSYRPSVTDTGIYYWRVYAFDTQGNESAYSEIWSYEIVGPDEAPTVVIDSPTDSSSFSEGENIVFSGSAEDKSGTPLTGTSLVWFSNIELSIGTGESFSRQLSPGEHTITLTAKDNQSVEGTASVDISVVPNEWIRLLSSSEEEEGDCVAVDSNGNAFITGWTYGDLDGTFNSGVRDIYVAKYDVAGTRLWLKLLGTSADDIGQRVAVDSAGGSYFTGYTKGNLGGESNNGLSDCFVAKYDTNGNLQWLDLIGD